MTKPIKIDVVSDVVCPWCAIGISGLKQAIARLDGTVEADIRFHPFELDTEMAPEGRNISELFKNKFGMTAAQAAAAHETARARAQDVGFVLDTNDESRMYNTFDAHRLLHWAGLNGGQEALKLALFRANFTHNRNISDHDVLVSIAEEAGLDGAEAREVLKSGGYADEVRQEERHWRESGVKSVPTFIINDRYLISGGQPVDAFEQALRQIAAEG